MATIEEIDAEIARRERITQIDQIIASRDPRFQLQNLIADRAKGAQGLDEQIAQLRQSTGEIDTDEGQASQFTQVPTPLASAARKLIGGAEGALALGTGIIAEPLSGFAGLAALANNTATGEGAFKADQTVKAFKKALTFDPRTDEGKAAIAGLGEALKPAIDKLQIFKKFIGDDTFAATNNAALAGIATALPETFIEILTSGIGGKAARQATRQGAPEPTITKTPEQTTESVAEVIQEGTPAELAAIVDADPRVFQAAEELGIDKPVPASFASQNPQFRSISNALEVQPGSILEKQSKEFIEAASKSADDLIEKFGGTKDKAQLGLDFKDKSLKIVKDLYDKADVVYGSLKKLVPASTRYDAPSITDFINSKADEVGGAANLPSKLKSMHRALNRVDENGDLINPTLGYLDLKRKEVGQAIGKKTGEFKDTESGLNKALYAKLSDDQNAIAKSIGGDALQLSEAGKGLVKQRKSIEDNLEFLLGKDLNAALNIKVSGAVKNLSKGEVDKFTETINAIPHKTDIQKKERSEIILSSMNDVFKGSGVNQTAFGPTQFTKWFQTIKRSPRAKKALFDALPKESIRAIENLFEVSRGISRSLETKRATGVSQGLFNEKTGFVRKMLGSAAVKTAIAVQGGPAASVGANIVTDFISQTSSPAKAASNLMTDPAFKDMIRQSVKDGVIDGTIASKKALEIEAKLMKTKRYKKWATALGNELPASVVAGTSGALIAYLFNQPNNEQPKLDFTISGGVKP